MEKGAVLAVSVGHPIVNYGTLMCSCAEVHEPIELSFGVVSGIGLGICILDGSTCLKERGDFGGFSPIGLNGIFLTEMYSTCV